MPVVEFHRPRRRVRQSRAKIQAVACDMAAAYWGAVLKHLPKVDVVFDHFHVIKLVNEKIDDLRRGLQREADILGQKYLKGTRYLLLSCAENVPEGRKEALTEALRETSPLQTTSAAMPVFRRGGAGRSCNRRQRHHQSPDDRRWRKSRDDDRR